MQKILILGAGWVQFIKENKKIFSIFLFLGIFYLLFNGYGVAIAKEKELVLNVGKGNDFQFSGYNGVQSFGINQDVILKIDGYFKNTSRQGSTMPKDIQVDVYKAGMKNVLHFLEYKGKGRQKNAKININNFEHQLSLSAKIKENFSLPVEGSGIWLVKIKYEGKTIFIYVVRSSYGAVIKEEQKGLLFWVQNLKTKRSQSNVPVVIYSLRENIRQKELSTTGEEGIAHMKTGADYDVAVIGNGNNLAIVPINLTNLNVGYKSEGNDYAGQQNYSRSFLFTDRPLYKPGDKVYFKFISRMDNDFVYNIPEGKRKVKIKTGWGESEKVIAEGEYDLDSFGSISGELQLPEDVKTGEYYSLEVENQKGKFMGIFSWYDPGRSVEIRIENYRKPEQEIEVSVKKREYINKDDIIFKIKGNYFSGEVLSNAKINYVVRSTGLSSWQQDNEEDMDNLIRGYGYGSDVDKGKVILNHNGSAEVNITATIDDGYTKVYSIVATYQPQVGEPVISQTNVLVYGGDYRILRNENKYSFNVGEDVDISWKLKENIKKVKLFDRELKITGQRVWWEVEDPNNRYRKYKRYEEQINSLTITSNQDGIAVMHFTPQKAGSYKFQIIGKDDRGNEIKRNFGIWVSSINDIGEFVSDDNNGLVIKVDKDKYQPQDKIKAVISSQVANRDVLLSIERDFVHSFQVLHLDGNTQELNFDIRNEYIPNMTMSVSSFDVGRLDQSVVSIDISAESKKLDIKLETDKTKYTPGEEVKIKISARDINGTPQKANIALWAVDKAIFELTSPVEQDIYKAFWDWRSGWTEMSHSLRGVSIAFADGKGGCFLKGTRVLMANGRTKNIEEIKVGEKVLTFNQAGQRVEAQVAKTHQAWSNGYLMINDSLRVTPDHIVWANNGWQKAEDIRPGDKMKGMDGKDIMVKKIVWTKYQEQVYNLIIAKEHSYIANGYFVHNGKDGGERSMFKDVAYWNPNITTDENGEAEITFKLPDDLTTWVLTAIGNTRDTLVGTGTKEFQTAKPVVIRPQVPNILRQGDKMILAALVQNNTEENHFFEVSLQSTSGQVKKSRQKVSIASGESKIINWEMEPVVENKNNVELIFSVVMEGDSTLKDVVKKKIPVEEFGFWESDSFVNKDNKPYVLNIDSDINNGKSSFKLTLSSTKLGALSGAMEYLIHYPYGCTEQTASAFMSAVLAKENPKFFKEALANKNIDEIIKVGVQKLSEKQNEDGGWSWWDGESNVFLSAYVAEYLVRAKKVRLEVGDEVLNKAEGYFSKEVGMSNVDYSQAEWVKPKEKNKSIARQKVNRVASIYGRSLFNTKNLPELKLDNSFTPDLIAMGLIANLRNGYNNKETNGYQLLLNKKQFEGNNSFWTSGGKEQFGSVDSSTGVVLRALLMAGADINTTSPIVQYLLNNRVKEYWSNTFSTAQVLEGFMKYAKKEQKRVQNYTAKIYLDGKLLGTEKFDIKKTVAEINIPSEKNYKSSEIISIIPSTPKAVIYSSLFTKVYHTSRTAGPVSRTISIKRTYKNVKGENLKMGIGDIVLVKFEVTGLKEGSRYFAIEDKLPAGMVPLNEHLNNVDKNGKQTSSVNNQVSHIEYTNNGAILIDSYVYKNGKHYYQYKARIVAGGQYAIPPASAFLMYSPEVYAHTGAQTIDLDDSPAQGKNDKIIKANWKTKLANALGHINFKLLGLTIFLLLGGLSLILFLKHKK